jgi:hypothetical protein
VISSQAAKAQSSNQQEDVSASSWHPITFRVWPPGQRARLYGYDLPGSLPVGPLGGASPDPPFSSASHLGSFTAANPSTGGIRAAFGLVPRSGKRDSGCA